MPPRTPRTARRKVSPARTRSARRNAPSPAREPSPAPSESEEDPESEEYYSSGSESDAEPEPQEPQSEDEDEDEEDELDDHTPTPEWLRLGAVSLVALIIAALVAQALAGMLEGLPFEQAIVAPAAGGSALSGADVLMSARRAAAQEAEAKASAIAEQLQRDLAKLQGDLDHQARTGQDNLAELRQAMATKLEISSSTDDVVGIVAALEKRILEQGEGVRRTRDELARISAGVVSREELQAELREQSRAAALSAPEFLRANEGAMRTWLRDEVTRAGGAMALLADEGQSHLSANVRRFVADHVSAEIDLLHADNTGLVDYAHVAAGGRIVPGATSWSYMPASESLVLRGLHALGLVSGAEPPEAVISSGAALGDCYPMAGDHGTITVRLAAAVVPTSFTLEHVPVSIAPNIQSAPRNVQVFGLRREDDPAPRLLATHEYRLDGPHVQRFDADNAREEVFPVVQLKVMDNHGHEDYTCVYRFRVHGVAVVG